MYRRAGLALAILSATLLAVSTLVAQERVDYLKQVKPVLTARCLACHGVLKQNAGLRLDTVAFALKGGTAGPVIKPGNPAASRILTRLTLPEHGGRMPPEGEPLKAEEIKAIRDWIAQGAKGVANEKAELDPRDHWAFRPIVRPAVPQFEQRDGSRSAFTGGLRGKPSGARSVNPGLSEVVRPSVADPGRRIRNPIDAFLERRFAEKGLKPQPEAPRVVLVRRLYLDLIGLPPSPEELEATLGDRSPNWYERVVDRLLADPRHGERWARHWMDIWRYSDWWGLGDQLRNSQPHIWHWRDWLVDSLNRDTPYDEMVRLQLAGDELYPNDMEKLRATGFLARQWFLFNRNQWMEETVEHVSKGFLGLTVNCAKCHDHKYDPIRQVDFYKLRAFFEPYHVRMDVLPGQPDLAKDGLPRPFDAQLDTPTYLFVRGQESQPDKSHPIAPGVPDLLAFKPLKIEPVPLPIEAWQPERRAWVFDAYGNRARERLAAAQDEVPKNPVPAALEHERATAEFGIAIADLSRIDHVAVAMRASWATLDDGMDDPALKLAADQTRINAVRAERYLVAARAHRDRILAERKLIYAEPDQKAAAEKALKEATHAVEKAAQVAAAPVGPKDTFTPLAGARWSATRFQFSGNDDPAVAFPPRSTGRRTALADWITDRRNPLTARVAINHLWTRHMGVPLVPTTFDFGRKGIAPKEPQLLDWLAAEFMDNRWSMKHLHRLIVTSAAYRRSSSQKGGEGNVAKDRDNVYQWRRQPIRLESEVIRDSLLALTGNMDLKQGGPPVLEKDQPASKRRSLYFFHSDNSRNLFLTTFDGAAVRECYRRDQSIVPQQALALTNSALVMDSAGPIAARLSKLRGVELDDTAFVRSAFSVILGIEPGKEELNASVKALESWKAQGDGASARAHLIWALLNHNDFVTLR